MGPFIIGNILKLLCFGHINVQGLRRGKSRGIEGQNLIPGYSPFHRLFVGKALHILVHPANHFTLVVDGAINIKAFLPVVHILPD